jgi:Rad3-related DNA helicase
LTSSFKLNDIIIKNLKYHKSALPNLKIFKQEQGMHLNDILVAFKKYKGPSVLISPSLFEGIDLPDDDSTYQLMIKAPFPSLANKRIATILKKYPKIYNITTLFKIIQGLGRSTRHKEDSSVSYCFDKNIKRLFDEKTNI